MCLVWRWASRLLTDEDGVNELEKEWAQEQEANQGVEGVDWECLLHHVSVVLPLPRKQFASHRYP